MANLNGLNKGKNLNVNVISPEREEFKNTINRLLAENNHKEIIKKCYDFTRKNKCFNFEVLNLLTVSLINLKQFRLALFIVDKMQAMCQNDEASFKNLTLVSQRLKKSLNLSAKDNDFNYLRSLFEEKERATISLCMIVKNEEFNIKKCLDSVKDIVSEIVIVDTGCTDNTIEIVKNYGAKIIPFKWINDFSAARNKSIEYATGDYILFLDADEYFEKDSHEFFRNLKKPSVPHSYFVRIVNFTEREADSSYFVEHYFTRIWVNDPRYRFTGKIHENLIFTDNAFCPASVFSGVNVYHTGYMKNEINRKGKFERNLALLNAAIKEEPENSFHEYNLAVQYKNMGMPDKAVEHFKLMEKKQKKGKFKSFYIFGISALASTYIQMKDYKKAVETALRALKINENFKEALFHLGLAQHYLGDYNEAIKNFFRILDDKKQEAVIGGTMDMSIRSWKTLNAIGICYIGLNDLKNAVKTLKKAFNINKYSGETVLNLILAYYKSGKISEIISLIGKIKNIKYPVNIVEEIVRKLHLMGLKKHAVNFLNSQKSNYSGEESLNELEQKFIRKTDLIQASVYYEQKRYKDADIFYSKYFNNGKYEPDEMSKWGLANIFLKNYSKAETILEKIAGRNQGCWDVFHNLGTAKMSLEKLDEAIELFKKAKDINPNSIETYLNLGKIYIYKKEYLNALEMLNYAAFLDKEYKNKELLYYHANALYLTGNYKETLEKTLLYQKIYGPDAECFYLTGLSYYMTGDYTNSSLFFLKAIDLDNEKIDYYVYLGNSLRKLGLFEDAGVFYQLALMADGNNVQAQAGYAALLLESTISNVS